MTAEANAVEVLRQHLIDPEICIRCNTCEETCPIDAITHDARNYVVDPAICNACNACISPCPTGAIDSWRQVVRTSAHSLAEQFAWDTLPAQQDVAGEAGTAIPQEIARITAEASAADREDQVVAARGKQRQCCLQNLHRAVVAAVAARGLSHQYTVRRGQALQDVAPVHAWTPTGYDATIASMRGLCNW